MPELDLVANSVDELAEEFARRVRAGERPSIDEYADRYPQWEEEIREVLSAVMMMEQLKPRREDRQSSVAGNGQPTLARVDRPLERLGEYRIIREIGCGGMGVVYEAEQESLGRRVAVKVLPVRLLGNEKLRNRFHREAQAAARLHHTNIVPVHEVGEIDGLCFYAMQLIHGRGLDRVLHKEADAFTPEKVAQVGVQVADALDYAHSQGVLHRDIKPSNLLLDDKGTVWLTDFGVAKLVEEANLTRSGDLVGTLHYMPPERFDGRSDARGDVYSLGVTLYELLAQRSAFPDTTPHHLIQLITQTELPRLRKLRPSIPRDLEIIVAKATARDPEQRYASPQELADDLRRFLDDRPIRARRAGPVELAWRWCKRNRASALAVLSVFLLLVIGTIVSATASIRLSAANREKAGANEEMRKALEAEQAQRENAENTSALALDALNRMYNHFAPTRLVVTPPENDTSDADDLPPQPTLSPEAVPLLEELLRTYEQIAQSSREFPRLQAQTAEANHRIGDIRRHLGRPAEAESAYRSACELYEKLLVESKDEVVRIKLARSYNELGRTLQSQQRIEEKRRVHDRALRTLQGAEASFAERPECKFELARTYYLLAQREPSSAPGPEPNGGRFGEPGRGRPPGPPFGGERRPPPPSPPSGGGPERGGPRPEPRDVAPTQQAIAILEPLVRDYPTVPEYRHLLACCFRDGPHERNGRGRGPNNTGMERSLELLRKLVKDFPKVPEYRFDLCETLTRIPPVFHHFDREAMQAALDQIREGVASCTELAKQYPNAPQYTIACALYHERLGFALFQSGDLNEALKSHRKAVSLQTGLVKQHPETTGYALRLCTMESSLAHLHVERGEWLDARTRLESAATRLEELQKRENPTLAVSRVLEPIYRELSRVLNKTGEPDRAAEFSRKADALGPARGPRDEGRRER